MIAGTLRAVSPGDIRYALYHSALKALWHLIGTALEVIDTAALIAVEMSVKIRDAVVVTLSVWRYDDCHQLLLGKFFRNVIYRRQ
jgi:hypothetical protein